MPLFELGYRRYEGPRTPPRMRWWPITRWGLALAWRSKLLRRMVFVAFLPFLYFGPVFFAIGRITEPGGAVARGPWRDIAASLLGNDLVRRLSEDVGSVRSAVWALVFATMGQFVQLQWLALVAAIAGPPLVANDLRTRAFLIYFSRPISRLDYVLGKAGTLGWLLCSVTLLPNLVLYVASIAFSPSLGTLMHTFPVAVEACLASLFAVVPCALLMLTLSALTRQPRFAAAAWAVVLIFGFVSHQVLSRTRALADAGWTFLLSPFHAVRAVQLGLYDVEGRLSGIELRGDARALAANLTSDHSPVLAGFFLVLVSLACFLILLRRVDAPTRV